MLKPWRVKSRFFAADAPAHFAREATSPNPGALSSAYAWILDSNTLPTGRFLACGLYEKLTDHVALTVTPYGLRLPTLEMHGKIFSSNLLTCIAYLDEMTLEQLETRLPRGLEYVAVGGHLFPEMYCGRRRQINKAVKRIKHVCYESRFGAYCYDLTRRKAMLRAEPRVHLAMCLKRLGLPRDMLREVYLCTRDASARDRAHCACVLGRAAALKQELIMRIVLLAFPKQF